MTTRRLKVLAIEDNEVDASILARHLSKLEGFDVEFLHCAEPEEVPAHLADPAIDLIFLDYNLGSSDGLDVLYSLREAGDQRPVVMLTGQGDEYVAARSIRAGADEYIVKADIEPGALARVIASAEAERKRALRSRALQGDLDELARENEELRSVALFDELTGLASRRSFRERLGQEIPRARRHGHPLCVMLLDLDRFKGINDTWGHAMGDCALARVGSILKDTLRRSDLPARLGGDELCALLPNADLANAVALGERIRETLAAEPLHAPDGSGIRITCSIGVAILGPEPEDCDALVARADAALYEAKRAGRDRVVGQPGPLQAAG